MRAFVTLAVVALVVVAFAANAMSSSSPARSTVTAHDSAYGRVLFDGRGFALYAFTRDTRSRSNCAAACATAWPPYIVTSRPTAGRGVTAELLGAIRRRDGTRQATYAGKPLYYYVGDREPLQILCQNVDEFGGRWLVVRPNGTVVR